MWKLPAEMLKSPPGAVRVSTASREAPLTHALQTQEPATGSLGLFRGSAAFSLNAAPRRQQQVGLFAPAAITPGPV